MLHAIFILILLFLVLSMYKQKKKWEKFISDWNLNFEIFNKIVELTKKNRKETRDLIPVDELKRLNNLTNNTLTIGQRLNIKSTPEIEENYDEILSTCDSLSERLLQVFQENAKKAFKNIKVEIKQETSDKES